jgi:fatty acid desaturase
VYFLVLYFCLGLWLSPLFIVIHQALFGLYLTSVIIPNHTGMPMLSADENPDFVRHQVLTARNIKGSWFVDYYFGGLNYQIEHHLFPRMPRNSLRKVSRIVRKFLEEKSIAYNETGMFQSYREIFSHLHAVAKSSDKG